MEQFLVHPVGCAAGVMYVSPPLIDGFAPYPARCAAAKSSKGADKFKLVPKHLSHTLRPANASGRRSIGWIYREMRWKRPCQGLERRVNRSAPGSSRDRMLLDVSKRGSERGIVG